MPAKVATRYSQCRRMLPSGSGRSGGEAGRSEIDGAQVGAHSLDIPALMALADARQVSLMSLSDTHPDARFVDWRHAFVSGVIAAALQSSEAFSTEIDSSLPVIRVRFGPRHYDVIVTEIQ